MVNNADCVFLQVLHSKLSKQTTMTRRRMTSRGDTEKRA